MKTTKEIMNAPNLRVYKLAEHDGYGELWRAGKKWATVVWSIDDGWEHVSISPYKKSVTPSWEDMCKLKDMFFYDEEWVVQYHPAKSCYVNLVENCLHLWRPIVDKLPIPE